MTDAAKYQFTNNLSGPKAYDEFFVPRLFQPWAKLLLDEVNLQPGEAVLDVATGPGTVARLAAVLRDLGMQEGDRVAMLAPNSHRYIEFYFGVLWGGGIVVPVNSRFALAEMIEQVRDAEPVALIVDDHYRESRCIPLQRSVHQL